MNNLILKEKFIYTISSEVKSLCEKFFTNSQINYFNYYRFFKNGEFYGLITTPELVDYHFSKGRIVTPKLTKKPSNKKFHYMLTPELEDGFHQATLDFRSLFNCYNFLYLYELNEDYFDLYVYHYSGNPAFSFDYYISNMDKLEHWKSEFKNLAKDLIVLADENRIILPSSMAPDSNNFCKANQPEIPFNYLTQRQLDCLYHIVLGKTSKEIAKELALSHRTVEHYMENIRIKLDCYSRSELITHALQITSIKNKLISLS